MKKHSWSLLNLLKPLSVHSAVSMSLVLILMSGFDTTILNEKERSERCTKRRNMKKRNMRKRDMMKKSIMTNTRVLN